MGLRERKAMRTRAALSDAVLTLAEELGYDAVTIEAIAERAEVGISTLYRYFPNKDAILLDPVAQYVDVLSLAFRERPAEEPRDEALGHALHVYLRAVEEDRDRVLRLRAQLDVAAGPRAHLWDLWAQQRVLLEEAIAERAGVEPTTLWVGVSAHLTMMIAQMALDRQRDAFDGAPLVETVDAIIEILRNADRLVPTIDADVHAAGSAPVDTDAADR